MDPMPHATGAAIGLWFPFGSAHEADGEQGLSHFVEHMVFKGAGDRDAEELSRVIDRVGGYLNAFTERETVCLHSLVPSSSASLAASVLLDMACRPRLKQDEFEREKDVLANEIMAADDDLEEAGQDEFFALTYSDGGLGRKIAGTVEEVRNAGFGALVDFHARKFASGPVVMSAAGNIDPKQLSVLFDAAMLGRPGRSASDPVGSAFAPARAMIRAPGSQVYVFTGLQLPVDLDENYFWRLSIASSAYGESMSSRLFMRLREQEGLCYSISSAFSLSPLAGLWGITSSTSPAQFKRFAEAYSKESSEFFRGGLSGVEICEAKSRLRGLLSLAGDDPEYRMKRLARQFLFSGQVETLAQTLSRLEVQGEITDESVNAMVKSLMDPVSENILLYGKIGKQTERMGSELFRAVMMEGESYG
ncbi:MAG: pitrilysin family protein [Spirochaetota bacterium]